MYPSLLDIEALVSAFQNAIEES